MTKSSDLLTGDLGYVAYFIGFVIVPIGLAIGGVRIGNDVLGQPVFGWVIGALGLVLGIAIGKYVAFGALFALGAGMMGGLAGLGIDWAMGWEDRAVYWGLALAGGGGFLFGLLATLVEDWGPGVAVGIDARLQEIARATPGPAAWKAAVEGLSEATTEERLRTYRLVREAGVLPADAALFLLASAVQWWDGWLPPQEDARDQDNHMADVLRRHGAVDLAELYLHDRQGFHRRSAQGRQFFFGPPDEELARGLRERGVLD